MNKYFKNQIGRLGNQKGSLLLTSYVLILILLGLGTAFVIVTTNESRNTERQRRVQVAFNIAEAGAERALYDLKQDFDNDSSSPSWSDGTINSYTIGPDTTSYYSIPYSSTSLNNGSYTVQLKNVSGASDSVWIKSTGTIGDATQIVLVYAKISNVSPWDNAIFAGAGASGAMVNGNVNIRGSVHILGTGLDSTDYAVDLGGTAELVGNNYYGLDSSLSSLVPALPTTTVNGVTVSTLNAELRVKNGMIGLSGSSSVGETNNDSNALKETVDGVYVSDGFGGTSGTSSVHSDNGWSNSYDMGDSVSFPSLSDPYTDSSTGTSYATYKAYLQAHALVITDAAKLSVLASITPTSAAFSYTDGTNSISKDTSGNLTISGIVYIDGGATVSGTQYSFKTAKAGANKTITYSGTGSVYGKYNIQIDTNMITTGSSSFPSNAIGFMTPESIGFNEANIDVMGLFYGETSIVSQKQTDVMGTFVSNYFNMGTNVPSIYQVPDVVNHLPPGLIGGTAAWVMSIVSWQRQ